MRMKVKKIGSSENGLNNDVVFCKNSFENEDMDESQKEANQEEMMEKLMNEAREEINHYVGKRFILS